MEVNNHDQAVGLAEIINEPGYDLYLAGRSQVARINSIDFTF